MVRFSVNYTMSFGIDVSQKEIDEKRKWLQAMYDDKDCSNTDYIWDLQITKDSTDEEIARFIGVENWRSAEGVNLEMEETCTYDVKREKELDEQDIKKHEEFKKMNPHVFNDLKKEEAILAVELIRFNIDTDKDLNKETYQKIVDKLEKKYSLRKKENSN